MTTIALNKNEIACDLQFTHPSGYKFKGTTKVHQIYNPAIYPKPFYVGFAGSVTAGQAGLNWLIDPVGKPPKSGGAEFVVLTQDKKMFTFTNPASWIAITDQHYSIGSGSQYAAGAMQAGKSPLEAVKIASKFDPNTGNGYKTFSTNEKGATKAPNKLSKEDTLLQASTFD